VYLRRAFVGGWRRRRLAPFRLLRPGGLTDHHQGGAKHAIPEQVPLLEHMQHLAGFAGKLLHGLVACWIVRLAEGLNLLDAEVVQNRQQLLIG
jgi:hypothetical protein